MLFLALNKDNKPKARLQIRTQLLILGVHFEYSKIFNYADDHP